MKTVVSSSWCSAKPDIHCALLDILFIGLTDILHQGCLCSLCATLTNLLFGLLKLQDNDEHFWDILMSEMHPIIWLLNPSSLGQLMGRRFPLTLHIKWGQTKLKSAWSWNSFGYNQIRLTSAAPSSLLELHPPTLINKTPTTGSAVWNWEMFWNCFLILAYTHMHMNSKKLHIQTWIWNFSYSNTVTLRACRYMAIFNAQIF